jgi:hypothetical protein
MPKGKLVKIAVPSIRVIRGQRVMLDSDLASIYGTSTMRLNEQFRRNRKRFPEDFAFVLTREEFMHLISQFAISKKGRGGRRQPPVVFTDRVRSRRQTRNSKIGRR